MAEVRRRVALAFGKEQGKNPQLQHMAADWVEAHFGMERDFNLAVLGGIGRLSGTLFPTLDPSLRSSSVGPSRRTFNICNVYVCLMKCLRGTHRTHHCMGTAAPTMLTRHPSVIGARAVLN